MDYEEITIDHLDELASLYVETFNSEPWNDKWTISTATKRLHQMINTPASPLGWLFCSVHMTPVWS